MCLFVFLFSYVALTLSFFAVVTMSEYLELPSLEGTVVSSGNPLPENYERPNRTTSPLGPKDPIPEKSRLQRAVEKEDKDVVAAREEKERKKQEKGTVVKKRPASGVSGIPKRKKRKNQADEVVIISDDHTIDANPLNQAEPNAQENSVASKPEGSAHPDENMAENNETLQPDEQPDKQQEDGAHVRSPRPSSDGKQYLFPFFSSLFPSPLPLSLLL
jgi:hypothetical protein